ncbi:hypothetical protein N8T08_003119 [Aspergillus melleus]|uniref:Uncharacterized protein n=1 Tax=Aspergillus melleus TaxID=138277 RepID=A0ACC3B7L7_9EURO|nr:hypothetical protein N8T08_003119 [Aspergillus melleus]
MAFDVGRSLQAGFVVAQVKAAPQQRLQAVVFIGVVGGIAVTILEALQNLGIYS